MNFSWWIYVIVLVGFCLAAAYAFWTIRREAEKVRIEGNDTAGFFVELAAWLSAMAIGALNAYVAYKFWTPYQFGMVNAAVRNPVMRRF